MNFKRYHVSRNISDVNTVTSTGWGTANSDMLSVLNSLEADTYSFSALFTLTERNNTSDNSTYGIVFTNTINTISNNSIKWNDSGVGTVKSCTINFDVTTQMVGKFTNAYFYGCGINQVGRTGRADVSNIMLNTGSQPLPYEPYGDTWHDTPHYIHNTSTDTLTTLPAVLYPNAVTATVGLKGDMEQSGTPSPTTPIQPSETGERTANLAPPDWAEDFVQRINNSAKAYISNNILHIFASAGYGEYDTKYIFKADWKENTQYTFNLTYRRDSIYSDASMLQITYTDGTTMAFPKTINDGEWHTIYITSEVGKTIKYLNVWYSSNWLEIKIDNFFVYEGTVEKPFEPYGIKIPISSAGQTTPVYLGEVQSTRRIKKLVLTGEEEWTLSYGSFRITLDRYLRERGWIPFCSHYKGIDFVSGGDILQNGETAFLLTNSGNNYLYVCDTSISTAADFKTYLQQQYAAGTPFTVWYVLATPTTGIVNEPLRKIGDYADEVSGITIPTIAGANTISVDTTLQPSEVTVNYKGWHPVANVHETEVGNNLFDYTTMATSAENSYLNPDGTIGTSNDWNISDYIPCDGTMFAIGAIGGNTPAFCLYDGNKQYITGKSYNTGGASSKQAVNITSQSTAKYIRFSYCKASGASYDNLSAIMLNKGISLLPYEPYGTHWT